MHYTHIYRDQFKNRVGQGHNRKFVSLKSLRCPNCTDAIKKRHF